MSRFANYRPSPALQAALDDIRWKIPHAMIQARKDAARGVIRGEPCLYAMDRPLRLAQRYARFCAHVKAKQKELV